MVQFRKVRGDNYAVMGNLNFCGVQETVEKLIDRYRRLSLNYSTVRNARSLIKNFQRNNPTCTAHITKRDIIVHSTIDIVKSDYQSRVV